MVRKGSPQHCPAPAAQNKKNNTALLFSIWFPGQSSPSNSLRCQDTFQKAKFLASRSAHFPSPLPREADAALTTISQRHPEPRGLSSALLPSSSSRRQVPSPPSIFPSAPFFFLLLCFLNHLPLRPPSCAQSGGTNLTHQTMQMWIPHLHRNGQSRDQGRNLLYKSPPLFGLQGEHSGFQWATFPRLRWSLAVTRFGDNARPPAPAPRSDSMGSDSMGREPVRSLMLCSWIRPAEPASPSHG